MSLFQIPVGFGTSPIVSRETNGGSLRGKTAIAVNLAPQTPRETPSSNSEFKKPGKFPACMSR
jgi:hypothetical protein